MFWFVWFMGFFLMGRDNYWKTTSSQGTGNLQGGKKQN